MRTDFSKFLCEINSKTNSIQEFYDPLTPNTLAKKKIFSKPKNSACFKSLFGESQDDQNFMSIINQKAQQTLEQQPKEDFFLKKIIANANNKKKLQFVQQPKKLTQFQPFSFNKKLQIKYPETPHFKNQLLSPFWKFNQQNRHNIQSLQVKTSGKDMTAIQLDSDPLNFVTQPIRYFIGIALKLKQKQCNQQARIFFKLACYVQPYNQKAWKKFIEFQEQLGYIYHSFILSKTAFLFCQIQEFAKSYLSNGQRCSIPLNQMKGIISSVSNPDLYEKGVLVQIAKLCLKYAQTWKGLKILHQICIWNQFRLPVCGVIIFLARYLQNIGFPQKALCLLKKSFGKSMSKLQIYTTFLQIKQRQTGGKISQQTINQLLDYVDFISGQNRYKLYLQIAEICFRAGDQKYKAFLEKSYFAAKQFCSAGTGCNKTLRQIFFTVLRWKKVIYPFSKASKNDLVLYESNRQDFVTQHNLKNFQFSDWKYYLHYGLLKREDILYQASKKWPHTGRLVAQWIHSIRTTHNRHDVLRVWRQKVKEVPKSGQLWCQGGRIYTQLKDFNNASKCFRAAIHFTPQYGDSFIEELKILLIKSRFKQIQKLKKLFIASEPFYGHVWSFIKNSNQNYKLSLIQIWEYAMEYIKIDLYKQNLQVFKSNRQNKSGPLTAFQPYNQAFLNPDSQQIRVRLFSSYEQIQNKN